MKKIVAMTLLILVLLAVWSVSAQDTPIAFGVYDPEGLLNDVEGITIERVYFMWLYEGEVIADSIQTIHAKGRLPLLSIEPYPRIEEWDERSTTLLPDTLAGYYDGEIQEVCQAVSDEQAVIAFAHEPEIRIGLFPWSGHNPDLYKQFFQYFVTQCREYAPKAQFMWSSAGDSWALDYYPGSDYVDLVGATVLSYHEWDLNTGGYIQSFENLFDPRYRLLAPLNKPIVISEFGVAGADEAKRLQWLSNAYLKFENYPQLHAVILFNAVQTDGGWQKALESLGIQSSEDFATQDWRLTPEWWPPPEVIRL